MFRIVFVYLENQAAESLENTSADEHALLYSIVFYYTQWYCVLFRYTVLLCSAIW